MANSRLLPGPKLPRSGGRVQNRGIYQASTQRTADTGLGAHPPRKAKAIRIPVPGDRVLGPESDGATARLRSPGRVIPPERARGAGCIRRKRLAAAVRQADDSKPALIA